MVALPGGAGQGTEVEDGREAGGAGERRDGAGALTVRKYGKSRFWAVIDATEQLVCITVYKRGALEVVRRLAG